MEARKQSKIQGINQDQRFDSYERTQFNPKPESIKMSTDLTPEQVFVHSAVERLTEDSLQEWFVDLKVTELVYEIELRALSKNRLSRGEAKDVYKAQSPIEEEKKGGLLSTLTGKK